MSLVTYLKEGEKKNKNAAAYSELLELLGITPREIPEVGADPKSCSASDYVNQYVFPVLLPAMTEMLEAAEESLVFQRKRTKFNACDYLTEYLYNNNPYQEDREFTSLNEIPFVQKILEKHPRPPLPLSLVWTEEEAAIILQSAWRGHLVRREPEVQELRQYQREMREESYHIMFRVEDFWKQHPVGNVDDGDTERTSDNCESS